jgi:DNA polymerase-2
MALAPPSNLLSGFILSRHWRDTSEGILLNLWLATEQGAVKLTIPSQKAVFFVRQVDADAVLKLAKPLITPQKAITIKESQLKNFYNEPVATVYCFQQRQLKQLCEILDAHKIPYWEADIRVPDRFLMERFISGGVELPQSLVTRNSPYFQEAQINTLSPSQYQPSLSVVSFDIETSMDARSLYSIAVYSSEVSCVFMVGEQQKTAGSTTEDTIKIIWCTDEKTCLQKFFTWLEKYDPDVLIGWHVVQFDCWVLKNLCNKWQVPFALGRDRQVPHWREDGGRYYIQVPGRVVLDGIELLRVAFYHFESFRLEFVAQELLGEGKLISHDDRAGAITDLFLEDKVALAKYNLQDCKLVWDIFEKTRLLDFAVERSRLMGLSMDKMGGSVASFDHAYLPRLHRKAYVAPNLGELESDVVSPGGYVMQSRPGLYQHVLVLDFKSLYPSIIRTFLIDPYAFWRVQHEGLPKEEYIEGFNGALFAREGAILPDLVTFLHQQREKAKAENNKPLSQAIKIIMNSFYGVLGSRGCRFFDPRVCSSITLRGHDIIQQSREWIEQQGHQVIYGDTDSIFVWLGASFTPVNPQEECQKIGSELAVGLNAWWQEKLQKEFAIKSALEIEFETHYHHFLMPTIRGSEEGSKKRYAGMVQRADKMEMVFKGLETVRADWTQLAKEFQKTLYEKVFLKQPYHQYINELVEQVLSGKKNQEMLYHKRLRRPVLGYQKSNPPHVKAARVYEQRSGELLRKGDVIDYWITLNGPEPEQYQVSPIDYQHYIDKQLKPVADSLLSFVGESFDEIIQPQMRLV